MNRLNSTMLILLSGTALAAMPALAQTEGAAASEPAATSSADTAATDEGSGEIIVTAQKRSERLSDVPLSITAATGDQLARQGITNPAQLEKIVPGFTFTKSSYSAPVYTIRGVGSYDEAIGISPTVSVYVDQVPLPFSRMTQGAALDLERVEVLKGPQGTLFGQNSTGGAINYIAAKPTDDVRAGAEMTLGRFGQAEAGGYVSGPIADGVSARFAIRTEQRGDWQQSYTRDDKLGQRNFTNARFLLDIKPSDKLTLEFGATGWYDKSDTQAKQKIGYSRINPAANAYLGSPGFPTLQADLAAYPNAPRKARAADWDQGMSFQRDDSFYQFSLRGDLELADQITLTSITAYSHLKVFSPNENDATDLPDSSIIVGGFIDSFSQELRLSGEVGDAHKFKWMIGGNYEHDHTNDTQFLFLRATNSGIGAFRWTSLNNVNDQKTDTYAGFLSADYELTDQLTLQGSVRYTKQNRDYHGCLQDSGNGELAAAFGFLSTIRSGTPTTIAPGSCVTLSDATTPGTPPNKPLPNGVFDSLDEDNLSWRGNISWKPSNDLLIYANITKGYKAGSFGTLPALVAAQEAPVKQESVLAYEAGFKASLLGRVVQMSGAVFYYDYKAKQLLGSVNLGPPFGTLPALVSIPKSRVQGAELDVTLRPVTGLTIRAAGTYVDSKVRGAFGLADPLPQKQLNPPQNGALTQIGGDPFPNTPKWQASFDSEYRFPIASSWDSFVGGNVAYRSRTRSFFGGDDNFILPGYALVDLRFGFEREDESLRVTFWGRNVTDKFYKTFVSRATDTIFQTVGMPATYGATVGVKF